jgi:hypothetical protein
LIPLSSSAFLELPEPKPSPEDDPEAEPEPYEEPDADPELEPNEEPDADPEAEPAEEGPGDWLKSTSGAVLSSTTSAGFLDSVPASLVVIVARKPFLSAT